MKQFFHLKYVTRSKAAMKVVSSVVAVLMVTCFQNCSQSRVNGSLLSMGSNASNSPLGSETPSPTSSSINGPTNFVATGNMNETRILNTATTLQSGKVLIVGGLEKDESTLVPASVGAELYDPATGTFSLTGSLTKARAGHSAILLGNGEVLIAGGSNETSAEIYNPIAGTFSQLTSTMLYPNRTATLLSNGNILFTGGNATQLYNVSSSTFSLNTNLMVNFRISHTSTLLTNGNVLLAGGYGSVGATAEIYNPVSSQFVSTGSLNASRTSANAVLLSNGTVLVAGGLDSSNNCLTSAEIYDPVAGKFTQTGSMLSGHVYGGLIALPNGKAIIFGGAAGSCANQLLQTAVAEFYDSATGLFTQANSLNYKWNYFSFAQLLNGDLLIAGGAVYDKGGAVNFATLFQ